jgi:hypothetical protein
MPADDTVVAACGELLLAESCGAPWDAAARVGRRYPAEAVPRRGGNAGRWKWRLFSFSRDRWKSFPGRVLEMAEVQKSGYFQMSNFISIKVSIANLSGGS